ncbi:MAG TPA: AI-2E family transporter [Terriglobales bacterium]|nr:AI-2E family transporter [Terriglobales bacterium]
MLFAFTLGALLYVAYTLRATLLLLWVSVLLAVLLTPIVDWISGWSIKGRHPGPGFSLLIFFFGVALALGLFVSLALPPILRDARGLSQQLPDHVQRLVNWAHQHLPMSTRLDENDLKHYAELLIGSVGDLFSNVTSGLVKAITVILLAAYFILDGKAAFDWMIALFPRDQEPRLRATLERGGSRMRRWLGGQGVLMLAQGVSATLVYWLLHVRYFYVLGLLAAIFNIIPVLGPVLTLIAAGLVAALDGFGKVLGVTIFYLVYHNMENAILNPRIMKARVHLPAVSIIVAIVIGDAVAGIVGVLIAVPTAALISEIIREYLIKPHTEPEAGIELASQ